MLAVGLLLSAQKAEEEKKAAAEAAAKRKAEEAKREAERKKTQQAAEAAAKKKAEQEANKKAEEEKNKQAAAEAAAKKAEEEAKKVEQARKEAKRKKAQQEAEEVGKSKAGKTALFRAIKEEPYKQDCGSTIGAELVDIEVSQLEFSEDSTWRVVPAADTQKQHTEQQLAIAKNVAAEYHQQLKSGGKLEVARQGGLQKSLAELQRERQRDRLEQQKQRKLTEAASRMATLEDKQKEIGLTATAAPPPPPAAPVGGGSQSPAEQLAAGAGLTLLDEELLLGIENGKITGNELALSVWDMGGQDVFHSLHHLFLKRGALYAVLFNMSDLVEGADPKLKQACLSHLRFWLRSLEMHAHDHATGWAPIFLVGTHKDKVCKEFEHRSIADILDHEFQGSKIYHCKKLYRPPNGRPFAFFPVDNFVRPVDPTIKALMRAVEAAAREEEYVKREIPVPWVKFFDKLFAKAKELSWLSHDEVLKLAQKCEVVNATESIDLILAYLHDQGRFFLEPVTRIICEFDTHRIPAHDKAAQSLPLQFGRLRRGMLDKVLLPLLLEDISAETKEHLLALMVKFGLAVELQPDASTAKDETEFLVPALLPDSLPAFIPESKMLPAKCSLAFYPRDEQVDTETNVERLKTLGFLPSGFFSRLVGKCFSWSQGWSAGVNWKDGWSFASAPATLLKRRAELSFGALRFEITVSEDLNLLQVSCGHENPRALLRRLLLLCKEVIDEALDGSLLVLPYLERNGALVRLEKAQEAVRKRIVLRVGHELLQPQQVVQEFSPGWFPSAQPPSKFDAFWSLREGLFDAALVGKLQERLLDMGVPPFMMAWEQQQGDRLEQVPSASSSSECKSEQLRL
eukprot:g21601.t1